MTTDNTSEEFLEIERTPEHHGKLDEIEQLNKQERREQIKEELTARLKDESIWLRLLQLVVFGFAFFLACSVLIGATILQFLLRLLTGEPNAELQKFGKNLGQYFSQIISFALFNSDDVPFPFTAWPNED